jgi:hypothetical protein
MAKPRSVLRYHVRNWRQYNRALINRGRLTVRSDEQAVAAWQNTEPAAGPGAPRTYAALAIEYALVCKSIYPLSLRAAQGFLSSVLELMRFTLAAPDYSCRRRARAHSPWDGRLARDADFAARWAVLSESCGQAKAIP